LRCIGHVGRLAEPVAATETERTLGPDHMIGARPRSSNESNAREVIVVPGNLGARGGSAGAFLRRQQRDWGVTVVRTSLDRLAYQMVFPYLSVYIVALGQRRPSWAS
jgi:hypothetical protein